MAFGNFFKDWSLTNEERAAKEAAAEAERQRQKKKEAEVVINKPAARRYKDDEDDYYPTNPRKGGKSRPNIPYLKGVNLARYLEFDHIEMQFLDESSEKYYNLKNIQNSIREGNPPRWDRVVVYTAEEDGKMIERMLKSDIQVILANLGLPEKCHPKKKAPVQYPEPVDPAEKGSNRCVVVYLDEPLPDIIMEKAREQIAAEEEEARLEEERLREEQERQEAEAREEQKKREEEMKAQAEFMKEMLKDALRDSVPQMVRDTILDMQEEEQQRRK